MFFLHRSDEKNFFMKAIIISKVFDKFDTILELDSNSKYFESSIEKKV